MTLPWLSVVMPTYNGAPYLGRALESIAAQSDLDVEVIAVDDGSDDATPEILRSFAARLSMTIVNRGHLGNWVANTNLGLSLARGEYVSILHQDDLWLPERLGILRHAARNSPETSLWLHPCWFIDSRGKKLGVLNCPLPAGPKRLDETLLVGRLLVQNFIGMPSPLFRRNLAERVGGLDETLWYAADWDFWLKLAAAGEARYLPRPLAAFRVHLLSQTARRGLSEGFRGQLDTVLDRHLSTWSDRLPDATSVERMSQASVELNVWLAARAGGGRHGPIPLLRCMARLGSRDSVRFLRYSRIGERLAARLRVGVGRPSGYWPLRIRERGKG